MSRRDTTASTFRERCVCRLRCVRERERGRLPLPGLYSSGVVRACTGAPRAAQRAGAREGGPKEVEGASERASASLSE
eukprot:1352658-Pleurochrysis_carterae.AAC.2